MQTVDSSKVESKTTYIKKDKNIVSQDSVGVYL